LLTADILIEHRVLSEYRDGCEARL